MLSEYKLEYHEGRYAVCNGIPFDENKSQGWKDGWHDGYEYLYGDEFVPDPDKIIEMAGG